MTHFIHSFCWQLLLGRLLLFFNDYYVLKITDIYVNNVNNKNAWILLIHNNFSHSRMLYKDEDDTLGHTLVAQEGPSVALPK